MNVPSKSKKEKKRYFCKEKKNCHNAKRERKRKKKRERMEKNEDKRSDQKGKRKRNFLHEILVTLISTGEFTEGTCRKLQKINGEMWEEYRLYEMYENDRSTKLLEEDDEKRKEKEAKED